ncbi:MAG: histone deacetylase [Verrucomicrobia bacterium]|nr:histone deacetylase [Verrucomicrobiota bacterium]
MRPEQPARVLRSAAHLRTAHPDATWPEVGAPPTDEVLTLAHATEHLRRLEQARDFDADTPFFPGIAEHARRAVAAGIAAVQRALASTTREAVFSLMRPPGHHATATQAMGFCYLNQVAVAALAAREKFGARRVAVWDFDAHHGNGTEAILLGREGLYFASVHQYPGYPGTGTRDRHPNVRNWPVPPHSPRAEHLGALRQSLDAVCAFEPDLILVSAGFDAYARDPITAMTLEREDFATLGRWLREAGRPAAALLEGGYHEDLPLLIDAFLTAWDKPA